MLLQDGFYEEFWLINQKILLWNILKNQSAAKTTKHNVWWFEQLHQAF